MIPLVPGSVPDTQNEARLLAGMNPPPQYLRVYWNEASVEVLFHWYQDKFTARPATTPIDSIPNVPPEGATPIESRITDHVFDDECADVPPDPAGCHKWRRGKDKRNAIEMVRIGYMRGHWISDGTFTWYLRDASGVLTRFQVEIQDTGLSKNWKFYTPRAQIVIKSEVVASPPH